METKDYVKLQAERTHEHLSKHVDRVLDNAEENHRNLTQSEVRELKDAWRAIYYAGCVAKS